MEVAMNELKTYPFDILSIPDLEADKVDKNEEVENLIANTIEVRDYRELIEKIRELSEEFGGTLAPVVMNSPASGGKI
jgi:chromatin segregation and condensation protein Rec8/ScpA/Scc1 (kleisin family)